MITFAVATNVSDGKKTSSFCLTPKIISEACKAEVPLILQLHVLNK